MQARAQNVGAYYNGLPECKQLTAAAAPVTLALLSCNKQRESMRLVFLGAPGSGKGTQAKKLVEEFNIPQISTGDLLRAAVRDNTETGQKAKRYMDAGQLVPDEIVFRLIEERLAEDDVKDGYILDGFPRNLAQAEELSKLLAELNQEITAAIHVKVKSEVIMKRLTGRRTCLNCGQMYNIHFSPPKEEGVCDACGSVGQIERRGDDNEETVAKRLDIYEEETYPIVGWYAHEHNLITIDGVQDQNEIFAQLKQQLAELH